MMNLPRHTIAKTLASGSIAYYWRPLKADVAAGFTLSPEPLGIDPAVAFARAHLLNQHLDVWRNGRASPKDLDRQPGYGTLAWLIERYKRSPAWDKVSPRVQPDYEYYFRQLLSIPRKSGGDIGSAMLATIDAAAADKIYAKLKVGPRGPRTRVAVQCITKTARAWDVVRRLCPKDVPDENPFRGVEFDHGRGSRPAATRAQAYALHDALVMAGERYLAVAPLVCFEWLQRPENILTGHLAWTDYRPTDRPNAVRILHHKTGEMVWMALCDEAGPFFPELTGYLEGLPRLGVPIVLYQPIVNPHTKARGKARPFKLRDARDRVRQAAEKAGLPGWLTLDACRHGGMTELADSDLTEQQEMSMSGHTTPDAKRRYAKRTEAQRLTALRKRRAWREEQNGGETQNDRPVETQNEIAESR